MNTLDITPSPKILRTLGEIPFQPWQCIAELIDNSIDAFLSERNNEAIKPNEIQVSWSRDSVAPLERTLEIYDNASGMTIEQMQNAVRAGYSSNNPISNLGLFGMGFNIATARLGECTEILTTREGENAWIGLRLDFDALTKTKRFEAPVFTEDKSSAEVHGTKIRISRLKPSISYELSNKSKEIKKLLSKIYSPLLSRSNISIIVNGSILSPSKPCVWDKSRYVMYKGKAVPACVNIDYSFGAAYFDIEKNRYLSDDEVDELTHKLENANTLPPNITTREKRLTGWIGIQRYAHPDEFGIDIVRNGRKILMSEKSFFSFDNPWTNTKELQYPVDLGTTVGGRIIGELHADFLLPTYQKNDFDRSDKSWKEMMQYLCGEGPFLPKRRKSLGFEEAASAPIALLANAYRRCEPGTRWLFLPSETSKRFRHEFERGTELYISDQRWFDAAREIDRERNGEERQDTPADPGATPSDNPDAYIFTSSTEDATDTNNTSTNATNTPTPTPENSSAEELKSRAAEEVNISGQYSCGRDMPFNVKAYKISTGEIFANGNSVPCRFENKNISCEFFFNPRHAIFTQYPISPKTLLLQYLSELIKVRNPQENQDIVDVFVKLTCESMSECRIDKIALQERAHAFFLSFREKITDALSAKKREVLLCLHESSGDVEEIITSLIEFPELLSYFQSKDENGYEALLYVPYKSLLRLVQKFPEDIFDGIVFKLKYQTIQMPDSHATMRVRDEAKDRAISYIKDALRLIYSQNKLSKNELTRLSYSIQFLEDMLV